MRCQNCDEKLKTWKEELTGLCNTCTEELKNKQDTDEDDFEAEAASNYYKECI